MTDEEFALMMDVSRRICEFERPGDLLASLPPLAEQCCHGLQVVCLIPCRPDEEFTASSCIFVQQDNWIKLAAMGELSGRVFQVTESERTFLPGYSDKRNQWLMAVRCRDEVQGMLLITALEGAQLDKSQNRFFQAIGLQASVALIGMKKLSFARADHERAALDLIESQKTLDEGQKLSKTGSWRWNLDTNRVDWSAETYRMYGALPEDGVWTQSKFLEHVHPQDRAAVVKSSAEVLDGKDVVDDEYRIILSDGSMKYLRSRAAAKRRDGRIVEVIGFATDITGERLAQERVAVLQEELERNSRLNTLGVISATIAHEISQPLSSITTNLAAATRWLTRDTPEIPEASACLEFASADATRMRNLVMSVKDLAWSKRIDATAFDFKGLIVETVELLREDLKLDRVSISLEVTGHHIHAFADRPKIQQVLINLLKNSQEALRLNSADHKLITIKVEGKDDHLLGISISDNGPGISTTDRSRLFSSLFTTKDGGMGVGLSISRAIVEMHGGTLWHDTSFDRGTRFVFEIPSAEALETNQSADPVR